MQVCRENTNSFPILHGRGIMKHPKPQRIIRAIKTFRCLKMAEQSFLQQINVDYQESIRDRIPGDPPRRFMYKRISKNMRLVMAIRKRILALEKSKFRPYLNKNPKMLLIIHLGILFFGDIAWGFIDEYLDSTFSLLS